MVHTADIPVGITVVHLYSQKFPHIFTRMFTSTRHNWTEMGNAPVALCNLGRNDEPPA